MIFQLSTKQIREIEHILGVGFYKKRPPYFRAKFYFDDHLSRISVLPIKPGYQDMIDFFDPIRTAYNNKLAGKKVDAGRVSINVSLYNEMRATLPKFLDTMEAKVRPKISDNENILKFLYFSDRNVFNKGSESEQLLTMDNWVLRFHDYPVLVTEEGEVSTWVENLNKLYHTKDTIKTVIIDDHTTLDELRDLCFDGTIQNFGTLLTLHSAEANKILDCYDTNLLKPDKSDPEKYKVNQFPMILQAGKITTSIDGVYVTKGAVVTDNRKNASGVWVWLSMTVPTVKPDYAKFIAGLSSEENKVPALGPEYAKYYNAMFDDDTAEGKLKITVKKRK